MSKKQAKPPTNVPPFSGSLNAVSGCFILMENIMYQLKLDIVDKIKDDFLNKGLFNTAIANYLQRRLNIDNPKKLSDLTEQILDNIDQNPHTKRKMNTAAYLFVNEFVAAVIVSTVDKINADEIKQ